MQLPLSCKDIIACYFLLFLVTEFLLPILTWEAASVLAQTCFSFHIPYPHPHKKNKVNLFFKQTYSISQFYPKVMLYVADSAEKQMHKWLGDPLNYSRAAGIIPGEYTNAPCMCICWACVYLLKCTHRNMCEALAYLLLALSKICETAFRPQLKYPYKASNVGQID